MPFVCSSSLALASAVALSMSECAVDSEAYGGEVACFRDFLSAYSGESFIFGDAGQQFGFFDGQQLGYCCLQQQF